MQNFDVFLPTSHTTSSRDAETNFHPQKPARGGEKFDDVMHRALTGPSRESNSDDQANEKPGPQAANGASNTHQSKHVSKSKKPLHREPVKSDTATAQTHAANNYSLQVPQIPAQTVPDDEGSSENESETGTHEGKHVTAVGTVTDATQLTAAQLVATQLLAVPGAPLSISLPSVPAPSTPGGNSASKEVKGISNPVLNLPTKAEALTSSPDLAAATKGDDKLVKPNSDPKAVETKSSVDQVDDSEKKNAPEKAGINLPHDAALQATESHSDKTDSIAIPTDATAEDQNAQPMHLNAQATNVPGFDSEPHGTSAAKQDMTMKKVEKTPKVAGPAEQDLPGNSAAGSEELSDGQKLSTKASLQGNAKAEPIAATETPAASRISTSVESAAPNITTAAVAPAAETDGRVRVLERTHDIVALHAMRLSETGSDSLHVVVKPGDGIQLSLELRKTQNGIEVRASLHKGDFDHLRQYWPELQQRLESRGVRVGTLTTSENFSSNSQQQFQQSKQQQSSDQDPMHAGAFAEFALAGSLSEAPAARAARATAYRGWETWA